MNRKAISRSLTHIVAVACIIVVPSLWLAPPTLWNLPAPELAVLAIFAAAYLVAAFVLRHRAASEQRTSTANVILVGTAVFGACFAAIVFTQWQLPAEFPQDFPRQALATSLGLGLLALIIAHAGRPGTLVPAVLLGLPTLVGLAGQMAYRLEWLPRPQPATRSVSYVESSLYRLQLTRYTNWIPNVRRRGGGLANWGSGYLLATGSGALFVFRLGEPDGSIDVTPLPRSVPLNVTEFVSGAREVFKDSPKVFVEASHFRVADILVQERGDAVRVFASHHHWNVAEKCHVVRVSLLEGTRAQILDATARVDWRTLYETSPCLPLNTGNATGLRFDGLEVGGRMELLNESELLLSVGDQGFDGVNWPRMLSQDPTSSYGKIIRVAIESGKAEVFSLGHRNVQGLYVDPSGAIWSTEHGPRGGDELNLIREHANYGWPLVTYGTEYSRLSWPRSTTQGRHDAFEKPVYAFVPSVAVSNLTGATSELFPLWQGDLLISSLKAQTVIRTHVRDNRVIFAEPIPVADRVRDILVGHDGRILLWTDSSALILIEPTQGRAGDALISLCIGCHTLNLVDPSAIAPNLYMIIGRRVAARDDFAYSRALRDLGGRWTRERLDAYIADPQALVPGTTMQFEGIKDPGQRAQLIEYLEHVPTWE